MSAFFSGVGVIFSLEMRQRVRGTAWYVLLGVFVALVAIVTVLLSVSLNAFDTGGVGGAIFSTIIYFVLLLGTLVAPALSGNAINGDRDAGTLATTQVTLISTWQLILGKFLAAWVTALAFLVASVPFLVYAMFEGSLGGETIAVSVAILAVELGVVAAVGVGLSGILTRPLFSIVLTYLVVAALSIGTLIAFTLGGLATQQTVRYESRNASSYLEDGTPLDCQPTGDNTMTVPRFDRFWGILVANPYVLLADAVPFTVTDSNPYPTDLFSSIKFGARSAQIPPDAVQTFDECEEFARFQADPNYSAQPTPQEVIDSTVPGWFVGLAIHIALAVAALFFAWRRTRTPAGTLSKGSRIA